MKTKQTKPPFVKGDILVSDYIWDAGLRGAIRVKEFSAARRIFKKIEEHDQGPVEGIIWRATCAAKPDKDYALGWQVRGLTIGWFERARLSDIREAIRKTTNKTRLARLELWLHQRKGAER